MNIAFLLLLVGCCSYALVAGGGPERLGASLYALACLATVVAASAPPIRFRSVEVGVLLVDATIFFAFCILAVRANRFWPIWVSSFLGLGVLGHLARWLGPEVIPWAYAAILSIWSYPILLLIALGTWNHRKRLARFGVDRSWSSFSGRSASPRRGGPTD